MPALRTLPFALLALVISSFLFLFMYRLISGGGDFRAEREAIAGIRFGPVTFEDEIVTRSRRKPPPPPPRTKPPPPPRMPARADDERLLTLPEIDLPELDIPLVGGDGIFLGNFQQVDRTAEGDIVPIVVIRPMYPREAALSGTEGWVRVEFTITESGTVKNPRVVEASPARIFNREAIRAILKWKFKPRVVDGVAVERKATQVIDFTLDGS